MNINIKKYSSSALLIGLINIGIALAPLTAQFQSGAGPIIEPIKNDTATQLETFYAQNGGRNQFSQITQDATQAFLDSEDAVVAGDFDVARALIDDLISQYPYISRAWEC